MWLGRGNIVFHPCAIKYNVGLLGQSGKGWDLGGKGKTYSMRGGTSGDLRTKGVARAFRIEKTPFFARLLQRVSSYMGVI